MKNKFLILTSIVFISLVVNFNLGIAETIVLKSGKKLEGKIIEKTDEYIKMDMEGVLLTFWLDEIERIDEEKLSSSEVIPQPSAQVTPQPPTAPFGFKEYEDEVKKYFKNKEYEKAIKVLNKAKEINPNDVETFIYLGALYGYLGRFEEAISSFKSAINIHLDTPNPDLYLFLGIVYDVTGNKKEAKEFLVKALEEHMKKGNILPVFFTDNFLKKITE